MNDNTEQASEHVEGQSLLNERLKIVQTHGFKIKAKDGEAEGEIAVALFDNGQYKIIITTQWEGKTDSVITMLTLSGAGFSLVSSAFIEAAMNMHNWPTKTTDV